MEIHYLDEVSSTHLWLIDAIKAHRVQPPFALYAGRQSDGIGSRGNCWIGYEGNLFLSFALDVESLPSDLPRQSMSIYFSWVLKETLATFGSKVWLKWPNDFYVDEKKAGGMITSIVTDEIVICSVGLNLKHAPENFAKIDVSIDQRKLLEFYFLKLKEERLWKDIFIKYKVEFLQSRKYQCFDQATQKRVSLEDAILQDDGSIIVQNRRVYSLR